MNAPLIVSAVFGAEDFRWLDGLRRAHFPPERNVIAAHMTLFHHLPPTILNELEIRIQEATRAPPPRAMLSGIMSLGRGTAFRVESAALAMIRADLAHVFARMLTPQDAQVWRPHVTVQNKVSAEEARTLQRSLGADFRPRALTLAGLGVWWYRDGPWDFALGYRFGSGQKMKAPRGHPGAIPSRGDPQRNPQ